MIEKRIKRIDCIHNFKTHGLPLQLFSGCVVCPYYSDTYWPWIYENEKESFEAAVLLDEKIQNYRRINDECYLHFSCRPLKKVIVGLVKGKELASKQLNFFPELIEECQGVCGI